MRDCLGRRAAARRRFAPWLTSELGIGAFSDRHLNLVRAKDANIFEAARSAKHSIGTLTPEEREFLRHAEKKYRANLNWFEFEHFAFGMRSPLFSRTRSHLDVLGHPLYLAWKEM
ncbi:MAG TPA: hypothetical protein VNA69_11715 [Thermoanaerobaculia bacterium]|nr:hypothetical protein [Thermoanaerobaculia bacterium]